MSSSAAAFLGLFLAFFFGLFNLLYRLVYGGGAETAHKYHGSNQVELKAFGYILEVL